MPIHAISKARYDQLVKLKMSERPRLIEEDIAWFATDGEKLLGVVIHAVTYSYWAYGVLERVPEWDNEFGMSEWESCLESQPSPLRSF